jgi:hypothetical protein
MPDKSKWDEFKELFRAGKSMDWRWRNFMNLIDDPIDDIKHTLHGARIFGLKIRLPDWLMRGRGDPDK